MTDAAKSWTDELRDWLWPVALAAMVFIASGRTRVAAPEIANIDKLVHFLVYGLLGTLLARVRAVARLRPLGIYSAVLIASLYGISDEFHQSFTPGRDVDVADWIMDTGGALLAVTLYAKWTHYRRVLESPVGRQSRMDGAASASSKP